MTWTDGLRRAAAAVGQAESGAAWRAVWADTRRRPLSALQNALGGLVAVATPGVRGAGPEGWRYVENCRGLGAAIPHFFGQDAITIGCHTFSAVPLDPDRTLYWHEYHHYQQSTRWGLLFLPAYLIEQGTRGYRRNRFEQAAARYGEEACQQFSRSARQPGSLARGNKTVG